MKFIDRKEEMTRLNRVAELPDGGVAVVWGRRRIGKTRLLLEWISKGNNKPGIYYTADESSSSVQRKYFAMAIEQALPGFSAVEYPDWTSMLNRLSRDALQANWRGPIIIDELPYLISTSSEFPSILQRFIDIEAKKAKLVLVLCGSSQRMMQGAVLDASAPLYGRAQEIIKLGPISAGFIGEALNIDNYRNMVESYSIWGGVPRYWELASNSGGSFLENIDRVVLDPMGPLNDEPNRLLLEEIPPAITLRPILDAVGLGAHRLSEIAARTGQPATSLVRPMQRLIDLDLITREVPYGLHDHNSKRTLYKIKDPFLRFWFDVVAPYRSYLMQSTPLNRRKWLQDNLQGTFSMIWEDLCRQSVPLLSQKWGEPFLGQAGRYWHAQEPEWDVLAESLDGKTLFLGEAKWTAKIPTQSWIFKTIDEMKGKARPRLSQQRYKKCQYGLFIPERPTNLKLPHDVTIIDAKDVITSLNE